MARLLFAAAAAVTCVAGGVTTAELRDTPQAVLTRALTQLVSQPATANLWAWSYGASIEMCAAYEAARAYGGPWASTLGARLDAFTSDPSSPAFKLLHNISMPWDSAIGDNIGLMPTAYLARLDFDGEGPESDDWEIAVRTAETYILGWPRRLPDGVTVSRDAGWEGQPDVNASFLWSDDQFMGVALLARLARHPYTDPARAPIYADFIARQQVNFAQFMQDASPTSPTSGLFIHGYNHATLTKSCCYWGRAGGWVMMAHAEVVTTLSAAFPSHPLLPQILSIWRAQAAGLARWQNSTDGRWHQVLNDTSTFLETSATAMNLYSYATGVLGGWLDRSAYDGVIRSAWAGLAPTVQPDGTVTGISCGTGVGTTPGFYEGRPTDYAESSPGLGSVFRAALAFDKYISAFPDPVVPV